MFSSSSRQTILGFIGSRTFEFCLPTMVVLRLPKTQWFIVNLSLRLWSCFSVFNFTSDYNSHWFNIINQNLKLHAQYNHNLKFNESYPSLRQWFFPIKRLGFIPWTSASQFIISREILFFSIMAVSSVLLFDLKLWLP